MIERQRLSPRDRNCDQETEIERKLNVRTIQLTKRHQISLDNPLITENSLKKEEASDNGELVLLKDNRGKLIGTALLGQQQKGFGWLISDEAISDLQSLLPNLFARALKRRKDLFNQKDTTAFRLFNGEGDGLGGVTLDYYDGYGVISLYSKSIATYLNDIVHTLKEFTDVETGHPLIKGMVVKRRYQREKEAESEWVFGTPTSEPIIILENGVNYAVYLDDGWMTGIFLDQREVRKALKEQYSTKKDVLNVFSYTGAFSVAAAVGGANSTTSVDLANRTRALTEEQFDLNKIPITGQKVYVMDTFDYFKYASRHQLSYDLIICDPPSFARNKKKVFTVKKNYADLIADSVKILAPSGLLVLSTNAANFKASDFDRMITETLEQLGCSFQWVAKYGLPSDFPYPKASRLSQYLKVRMIKVDR